MKKRNLNLDFMRLLGVLIIMVAHSSPPDWLFQLRNFGTPLLIVASALTYSFIYANRRIDIVDFYKKRLNRLIFPAWIFLSFFFLVVYVAVINLGIDYPFSTKNIVSSYMFMGGIGFVWILKVYIILALITPFVMMLDERIESNKNYFSFLLIAYVSYELLVYLLSPFLDGYVGKFFNEVVFIVLGYSILYCYGFRLSKLANNSLYALISISFFIFASLVVLKYSQEGHFVATQGFKYPPTIYYLSYAFFATNIVYLLCRSVSFTSSTASSIIVWLSSNSLWIYLWHIMAFYLWDFTIGDPKGDFIMFFFKTIFLLSFGIVMTMVQNKVVVKIIPKNSPYGQKIADLLT